MKKLSVLLMAGVIASCFALSSCTSSNKEVSSQAPSSEPVTTPLETEDKKEIMVVSFGTSYNDSRDITIGAIEKAIEKAFPDYSVRRAFTSQIIIDILKEREGLEIDTVEQALDRAVADGIKTLIVQPTHLMNGYEYTDLANAVEQYKDKFEKIVLGEPLLTSDEDFKKVMKALVSQTTQYDDGQTAICFMGHGTEADSNSVYAKLHEMFQTEGYQNYFVGTVEATPSLEDLMTEVQEGNYKKVVLAPLMVVSGDHANNDMAGAEEDSWKSQFESAGYEVECILRGMGEFSDIQNIYVEHVQTAIDKIA